MVKCGLSSTPEEVVLEKTANRILHRAGYRLDGTPERPERRHQVHTVNLTAEMIQALDTCRFAKKISGAQ
ncbi:MAG: hypothetical protein WA060_01595 [Minisyncoccia bacterium]